MRKRTPAEVAKLRFNTVEEAIERCAVCRTKGTVTVEEEGFDQDGRYRVECICSKCVMPWEVYPTQFGIYEG